MWIQLHSKPVQTSLGETFFQTLQTQLTSNIVIVIPICSPGSQNQPIGDPVPEKHALQGIDKDPDIEQAMPFTNAEHGAKARQNINVQRRDQKARKEMPQNSPGKFLAGNGDVPVHPKYERREQAPGPPYRKGKMQSVAPVFAGGKIRQGKHTPENRPCHSRKSNMARTGLHPFRFRHFAARSIPSRSARRSISPHPKKLFAIATATSLSPTSRGNVKAPFSSEHRASGNFLAPSCSNRFLSAYTSFPFTNTHTSRVHPISTFFVCFSSEVTVVFSHATARFGSGRGRPYSRLIFTSPFRSVLIVFHSCEAPGISLYMGSLAFGSAENGERRQFRTRPRSPSSGSLAGSGERLSTASGVITMFAKVPGPCSRRPPLIASPSSLPTTSVGDGASFTKTFIRRPDMTILMWFHPFSRSGARV